MTSTDNTSKVGRIFWVMVIFTLIILPFVNFFVVDYFEYRFSGDVTKNLAYDVMYYLSESLAFVFKYITLSTIVFAVFKLQGHSKATVMILSLVSLIIPYVSLFFIAYFETSNFSAYFEYYLVSALINFGVDVLIAVLTIIFSLIIKSKSNIGFYRRFMHSLLVGTFILFIAELSVLIYETVDFVLELKYEYYDSMTPNELINIVVSYASVIIRSILAYFIMRINANALTTFATHGKQ